MKIIFSILFIFLFVSCDSVYFLTIQDVKKYIICTKCDTIEIRGAIMNKHLPVIFFKFNGNYTINVNSLIIYPEILLHPIQIYLNGKQTPNNIEQIIISKDDILEVVFRGTGNFYIIPSNFIECNGEPVIMDTIKVNTTQIPWIGYDK